MTDHHLQLLVDERRKMEDSIDRAKGRFYQLVANLVDQGLVSQKAVTEALGVSRETVRQWCNLYRHYGPTEKETAIDAAIRGAGL